MTIMELFYKYLIPIFVRCFWIAHIRFKSVLQDQIEVFQYYTVGPRV